MTQLLSYEFADLQGYSRTGITAAQRADGTWFEVGANVPARDARGLAIYRQGVNAVRNPRAVGAGAGVTPTNWQIAIATSTGVTATPAGIVTIGGVPCLAINLSGTPVGAGALRVYFETTTGAAAATGQTWTFSAFQARSAGLTGLGTPGFVLDECASDGSFLTGGGASIAALTTSIGRQAFTRTLAGATTAFLRPYWQAALTNGVAVSGTLYLGWPQMEQNATATPPILPAAGTVAASTRGNDGPVSELLPASAANAAVVTVEMGFLIPSLLTSHILWQIAAATDFNDRIIAGVSSGQARIQTIVGGVSTGEYAVGAVTPGVAQALAVSWDRATNTIDTSLNGGAVVTAVRTLPPGPYTLLRYGHSSVNWLDGYRRRFAIYPRRADRDDRFRVEPEIHGLRRLSLAA